MVNLAIFTDELSMGQAALISLVCMLIVFCMLALLWGIVALMGLIKPKAKKEEKVEEVQPSAPAKTSFKLEDIKDDDMMAAALIATIDYHNEIKKDVRVVSIKEL